VLCIGAASELGGKAKRRGVPSTVHADQEGEAEIEDETGTKKGLCHGGEV